jgi:hypothetical protein
MDAWTSAAGDAFLSVTGHRISAPADAPNDWCLESDQLAFKPLSGRHTGQYIGDVLMQTIDIYGLSREKVITSMRCWQFCYLPLFLTGF